MILEFLGYDPFPLPEKVSEHLAAKRRKMGWSMEKAAKVVGVNPSTWGDWENGRTILLRKHRITISNLLNLPVDVIDEEMATRWGRLHERTTP